MSNTPPASVNYESKPTGSIADIQSISAALKVLAWAILANISANICFAIAGTILEKVPPSLELTILILGIIALLAVAIFQIYALLKLMEALAYGKVAIVIFAIGSLLSCIGTLIMVAVIGEATTRLRKLRSNTISS